MTRYWLVSLNTAESVWLTMAQYIAACDAAYAAGRHAPAVIGAKCA